MNKTEEKLSLFSDIQQRKRYLSALVMILLMIEVAELFNEKEIIFPEMAALTIGMWIVNKRVWRVKYWQMLLLMTLGACAGVLIVLYSPFSLIINVAIAFFGCCHRPFTYPCFTVSTNLCLCTSCIIKNGELDLSIIRVCDDPDYHCCTTMDGTSGHSRTDRL